MSYFEMGGLFADIKSIVTRQPAQAQTFVGRTLASVRNAAMAPDAAMSPSSAGAPRPPGTLPAWALPAAAVGSVGLLALLLRKRRNPCGGRRRRRRR